MPQKAAIGKLYIVSTPIGNPGDITLRAIETLRQVTTIVCEELRPASTLLKRLGIEGKELVTLNEHNEEERAPELLTKLFLGADLALISDCGTPVFSDPGAYLIQLAVESSIQTIPIPGASSLMAALSVLDFKLDHYLFCGFLSRDPQGRRRELANFQAMNLPLVIMDAPYRLAPLLQDIAKVFGANRRLTLACDLTLPGEKIYRDTVANIIQQAGKRKAEFVLIIHATSQPKMRK